MDWQLVEEFLASLSTLDYLVVAANLFLFLAARPLIKRISAASLPDSTLKMRVNLLRGINAVILLVYGYQYFYKPAEDSHGVRVISILVILYLAYFSNHLTQFYIHKFYGKPRDIGGKTHYIETYQTRLLSILAAILITVVAAISIIHQLGFDSLLEAGGVLGVLGVMLGLTQAAWAPDIISGLIILNSTMFEEGDIVEIDGGVTGRVFKTKLFHTEILNLTNNHRIMIRNAQLRDRVIHNLSKFASAKGLRELLVLNIGYDVPEERIRKMVQRALQIAIERKLPMETQHAPELKLLDTGDHALSWGVLYHTKQVDQIISVRRDFRLALWNAAEEMNISLATPLTHAAEISGKKRQQSGPQTAASMPPGKQQSNSPAEPEAQQGEPAKTPTPAE